MNNVNKIPLDAIGYEFMEPRFVPPGKDEYHLRNLQNRSGTPYRQLNAYEIEVLVRNRNTSDDWNKIQVSDAFNPELVKACKFYGLVRIGKLEPFALQYHNVCLPVGLYNSTIISSDFGDNVVVSNVNYISHYIIGNEVMLSNVHELHTTDHSKFGNGTIKDGEDEAVRIWLEVCNENGGRKILPFNGMLPGDAWLWSKYRDDAALMQRFKEMTDIKFDKKRGYYGKVGDRTVIKNTSIIKDVWVGSDAYIKGANKLKNLTINSAPDAQTQIGEGCEIVNGIIGYGCRVFYGVKAVRFVMASHSQLKYGARLINSYLGNNATISCCEVLNSLIFPAHEQHHNNSFLVAALVMGQSNIAAGATIGSNHNSRAADGEFVAGRGFWPGLCISLKHNSRFASFTLIAKGDYPAELDIRIPFSLVSNDVTENKLVVMPAYWFMYNMYGLARNAAKYVDRDQRTERIQHIEYDFLAPDSVNELFHARSLLAQAAAAAFNDARQTAAITDQVKKGDAILNSDADLSDKPIFAHHFENSNRPVQLLKVKEAYAIFKNLIVYYGITQLVQYIQVLELDTFADLQQSLPQQPERTEWLNLGGQLVPQKNVAELLECIKDNTVNSWDKIHDTYAGYSRTYNEQKLHHAFASLLEITGIEAPGFTPQVFGKLAAEAVQTKTWMYEAVCKSRAKDYQNAFRKMIYDNEAEMEAVVGRLEDNAFIKGQQQELETFKRAVQAILQQFGL
jgi:hypothetical protein